jgi:hypothetical protein
MEQSCKDGRQVAKDGMNREILGKCRNVCFSKVCVR